MRSLFAGSAAVWFIFAAFYFVPEPFAYANSGQSGGIDGDAGAVAITMAARTLFAGLSLIALALIEWGRLEKWWRSTGSAD